MSLHTLSFLTLGIQTSSRFVHVWTDCHHGVISACLELQPVHYCAQMHAWHALYQWVKLHELPHISGKAIGSLLGVLYDLAGVRLMRDMSVLTCVLK